MLFIQEYMGEYYIQKLRLKEYKIRYIRKLIFPPYLIPDKVKSVHFLHIYVLAYIFSSIVSFFASGFMYTSSGSDFMYSATAWQLNTYSF